MEPVSSGPPLSDNTVVSYRSKLPTPSNTLNTMSFASRTSPELLLEVHGFKSLWLSQRDLVLGRVIVVILNSLRTPQRI